MSNFSSNFWQKVAINDDFTACWRWKASKTSSGYGFYRFREAHRVAFELFYGKLPPRAVIYHACGEKLCCNPEHLLLGTPYKPLFAPPKKDYTPLTWNDVLLIRTLRKEKTVTVRELAAQFGVSPNTISRIANNRTWTLAA